MKFVKPMIEKYQNQNWLYIQTSEERILIVKENEHFDNYQGEPSVPWGLIVCEIPIHYWLRQAKVFHDDLNHQLMHASLIAQAPYLFRQNAELRDQIEKMKNLIPNESRQEFPNLDFPKTNAVPNFIRF